MRSTRFRLLETLRQYALERLDDSGHAEDYRRRHAEHYATFAEAAGPGLEGPDEAAWVGRFDAELDNLRAAVAWALDAEAPADAELGLRIIAPLVGQSFYRPSAGVGEWAEAALERGGNLDTRPALRSARRRGLESAPRRRPRPRAHACVRGAARRAPPRHALPRMGAQRARQC